MRRLAQEYLAKIEKETKARGGADDDEDEDEDETERMTKRLNDDLLRERGKLVRDLAERVKQRWEGGETPGPVRLLRGHRLPLTCSALSDDDTMAVSGAKDGTIIRWDVETGGKVVTLKTEENRALGNQVSCSEGSRVFAALCLKEYSVHEPTSAVLHSMPETLTTN